MKRILQATVEPEHVDELGHLNHALALRFFERARVDWYTAAELWEGRTLTEGEELGTVILNINFNYRAECFIGDNLTIETEPLSRGTKSYTLAQTMRKSDGEIAIEGSAICLVMNMRTRKSLIIPECLARYFPPSKHS